MTEIKELRESRKVLGGEQLMRVVCEYYGIKEGELRRRSHRYTEAREVASYIMRRHGLMRLVEIGEKVGTHYSTVGNVIRKIAASKDRRVRMVVSAIEGKIKNQ